MTAFLVFADGAGEDDFDYSVVLVQAGTPREAAEKVSRPGMGYGKTVAYVVAQEDAHVFALVERLVTEPTSLGDIAAGLRPEVRKLYDPDGTIPA